MSDIAISVEGIGKRYRLGRPKEQYGRLTESIASTARRLVGRGGPKVDLRDFWALRDISFEVQQGEVLGIIGRNGAGKSTLLKILSRITEPTTGEAILRGRVGSLLEVGTGMHPELSGRENVFLSGAILGMRHSDIVRRFDEIVEFADVTEFLDTPVKRYSSGMKVRLGFAVAAYLEPEILIVDEVLAVGDAEFQRKCLARMNGVANDGRTVLFVSHNLAAVESLCTRAFLLEQGRITDTGVPREVAERYLQRFVAHDPTSLADRTDRTGDGRIRIVSFAAAIQTGSTSQIRIGFHAEPGVRRVDVQVHIFGMQQDRVTLLGTEWAGEPFTELPSEGVFVCEIDRATLLPGPYRVNVRCYVSEELADFLIDAATLDVVEGDFFGTGQLPPPGYGHVVVEQAWSVEATDAAAPVRT